MLAAWELNQVLSPAMHANRYCATALPPDMGTQLINFNCKAAHILYMEYGIAPPIRPEVQSATKGFRIRIQIGNQSGYIPPSPVLHPIIS